MKSGWVTKKLGEVCEALTSQLRQKDLQPDSGEYPVYGASGFITKVGFYQSNTNCVGLVKDGAGVGRVMLLPPFSSVIGTMLMLVPRATILNQYFYYLLVFLELGKDYSGATIPHVYFKDFKDKDICLPPLAEQKRIVAKIDEAFEKIDALKANAEKNLANAKELFQSALDEAFKMPNGEKMKLGDVCDVLAGYPFKGSDFSETGIKICGGLIITPNEIKWNECKYWGTSEGLEDYLLAADDIVIALDRPWIASGFKIGMIEDGDLPCLLIQRTARLRAKKVAPKYLLYLLRRPEFKEYCTFTGATVPHISHKDIERYMVSCPPLAEQRRVVRRLDSLSEKLETLQQNYARQIADCAEMRQAILREAFEGGL